MKEVKKIRIESILIDNLPVNKKTFDLALFIYQGGEIPPIRLEKSSSGGYLIKDGRHRVCAFKLLGRIEIKAYVCENTQTDIDKYHNLCKQTFGFYISTK